MSVTTGVNKCGISSYTPNSSILGSIKINLTSLLVDLYSMLTIIELIATDFPEPVVPATNKCGVLAKSITTGFPDMFFPSATEMLELAF